MELDQVLLSEEGLEEALSRPHEGDISLAARLDDDVVVLGAGGKLGPTLVQRITRALDEAGSRHRVYAVSRYSDADVRERIEKAGAETITADLMNDRDLERLPDVYNVIYLVGMKFGASGNEPLTWALNTYLPGRVASRYGDARIVALSTGNVYPLVSPETGGCSEDVEPAPMGEYAQSCLGRERVFEHFSLANDTPACLVRLNYAVETRYGVLLDIAQSVYNEEPLSVEMGYVNTIWQGDANSMCFRALEACSSPARILNVTGPEILSVRALAEAFARRFGVEANLVGTEAPTAFLNDASEALERFGPVHVDTDEVIDLVASWVEQERPTYDKPTKFTVQDGQF